MSNPRSPDWDTQQLDVILQPPSSWQLVEAGPGAGKSAVACQRVAYIIDQGLAPPRILVISFTRTAVAELRDRIVAYAVAGEQARTVRISTIDSTAWSLRVGFDDEQIRKLVSKEGFDLSIERTVQMFRERQSDLLSFMGQLEHVIIDEAQDIVGIRGDLIVEMLRSLSTDCGVTILTDPAQAIYGFTSDDSSSSAAIQSLISRLASESPRRFELRKLEQNHRIKNGQLAELFMQTRKEIESPGTPEGHVARLQKIIKERSSSELAISSYSSIAEFLVANRAESMLVLFRKRAEALLASSYCSGAGLVHRLRLSGLPTAVRPWLGWLLGGFEENLLTRDRFDALWKERESLEPAPFIGESSDRSWQVMHRLSAGRQPSTIDLVQLRRLTARTKPPIDLCYPELGSSGPILGTIHASKGREADTVVLVMNAGTPDEAHDGSAPPVYEEGRVYYVGATRARSMLITADGAKAGYVTSLESGRCYRPVGSDRFQLEIGREGDVDHLAHLNWSNSLDIQRILARSSASLSSVYSHSSAENAWARRLIIEEKSADGVTRCTEIGQLSDFFKYDVGKLWGRVDKNKTLRPSPTIRHLYLVAVTTVGLSDEDKNAVGRPFSRSGFALVGLVKGFPVMNFLKRKWAKDRE